MGPVTLSLDRDFFHLKLMSWGDGTGVPTSGHLLVIVGTDKNGLLHIRGFDEGGQQVIDEDEKSHLLSNRWPKGAIATLKQQLGGWLPPHELTFEEREQVVSQLTSCVGPTLFLIGKPKIHLGS